jgi:fructuronate reductase
MIARLSYSTLNTLPAEVRRPTYDRGRVTPGIVHLGIGAFHRAHMAVYVDKLLGSSPEWGIVGASLRRPDTRDALAPQDGFYTLAVRDASGTNCEVIGSIIAILDAQKERDRLLGLMVTPQIRIVSLTITEKGYCHDPATGRLDEKHPDIIHDLANRESPISAPGILALALERRWLKGIPPFAVMSCDNLPANGVTASRIVTRFAELRSAQLGNHVRHHVAFPSTMVDRIVPATTDADRQEVAKLLGVEDAWPVVTEPFTQWVIEDKFPAGRPAFERVGVQIVADVEPFEKMKLRMLNGSHSTLAYLGYLAGHQYVADVMQSADFTRLIQGLMTEEAMPTLNMPGTDLGKYRDELIARFANPALKHRTWQIAMDGSQKLPQRLLGTIRDRLARRQPIDRLSLGVAAWMRYATGIDEEGAPIDVKDPLANRLRALAEAAKRDPVRLVVAYLTLGEVFSTDLPKNEVFREAVTAHLKSLYDIGSAATVAKIVAKG